MSSILSQLIQPNALWVLSGSALLGASSGAIGCFLLLRRRALAGDVLAHSSLPGVTTAFILFRDKSPEVLFLGALVSCVIAYALIEFIITRSKIKQDSAYACILSLFFALGGFQLTSIQKMADAAPAGLDKILFGQVAALVPSDITKLAFLAAGVIVMIILYFDRLRLVSFDPGYARGIGLNVLGYEALMAFAVVSSVVVGIQLVGVVLLTALLVTPPAAARFWTDRLSIMVFLSAILGSLAAIAGAVTSYFVRNLPSGPAMVLYASAFFLISLLFAPLRGMIPRWARQRAFSRKVREENLLRTLFKVCETEGDFTRAIDRPTLLRYRRIGPQQLERTLERLIATGLVLRGVDGFSLSSTGLERAERLTRVHRLWELYLSHHVHLPPDHVHECAEEIEHIITPELEAKLLAELADSSHDPHGRVIPGEPS